MTTWGFARFWVLALVAMLCACIVPPVEQEYPLLLPGSDQSSAAPGQVRVLIFNTSHPGSSLANSGIDVWIDGKGAVRLETGQYAELFLASGSHELKLLHQDLFNFYSTHRITIDATAAVIEICFDVLTNKARVLGKLPALFKESFTPVNAPPTSYFGLRSKPYFTTRLETERVQSEFCTWESN